MAERPVTRIRSNWNSNISYECLVRLDKLSERPETINSLVILNERADIYMCKCWVSPTFLPTMN